MTKRESLLRNSRYPDTPLSSFSSYADKAGWLFPLLSEQKNVPAYSAQDIFCKLRFSVVSYVS